MTNAATEPATEKPGFGDLAEIFYAPGTVFARRRDGSFGLAYAAIVVLGVVIYFATRSLVQPIIDAEISRSLAQTAARTNMTADQMATVTSIGHTTASIGVIGYFVIAPFIIALCIWIAGKLAKVEAVGKTAIMIAVFSLYPRLVGSVVGAIMAAMLPDGSLTSAASLSFSPARFVDPSHLALVALLGRFDLFILWGGVLIAIGMRSAAKATRGQAWATALGAWLLAGIPALLAMLRG
jgi:hypothetical protein